MRHQLQLELYQGLMMCNQQSPTGQPGKYQEARLSVDLFLNYLYTITVFAVQNV